MRSTVIVFIAATALAAPLAAAPPSANDFRLPAESTPRQPPEDMQGPVAPDLPESRPLARTPAPAPAPSSSTPRIAPPPVIVPPPIEATPNVPVTRPAPARTQANAPPSPVIAGSAPAVAEPAAQPGPFPAASPVTTPALPAPAARAEVPNEGLPPWLWALGGALALGAAAFAAWLLAGKRPKARKAAAPHVERPRITPYAPPAAPAPLAPETAAPRAPLPPPTFGEPLEVTLHPVRLSLTLMNAALAWRLEVSNQGPAPLTSLTIGADMIAAHASMSREEQLSGPGNGTLPVQKIERLEPGESRMVEGEFRLPFGQIVPIRQGSAALLLPLARFRVEAEGARPLVRTFAVGQPGNGSGLQPFRLDQGPRIYPRLAQRAFA